MRDLKTDPITPEEQKAWDDVIALAKEQGLYMPKSEIPGFIENLLREDAMKRGHSSAIVIRI